MFFARNKGLFDLLLPLYGTHAMKEVQNAFDLMGLPMPDKAEYRDTTDGGALVLLNPYGSTVRVTSRTKLMNETALRHPRILQPLGTFSDTALRIDIFPGISILKGAGVPHKLFYELNTSGLVFEDSKVMNCGAIHNLIDKTEYAVVLDTPAVKKMYDAPIPEDQLQTQLYGHLRQAFATAMEERNFKDFWNLCANELRQGSLKSSWMDSQGSLVEYPAAIYERHLIQNGNANHTPRHNGYNLSAIL